MSFIIVCFESGDLILKRMQCVLIVMVCLVAQISMGELHPLATFLSTGLNEFYCFGYPQPLAH